ncbi:ribonuclease H-like domain-containing protein [Tanacetum coccineum]
MAIHLLNFLPSTAINNEIPYTRLFGTNPDYRLLRTFGCLRYPYLHTNHKLEPRVTPSIFLGYASNHRGYHCLELSTNTIIIFRHVTFDETVFPYGSIQPTSAPNYTFLDDSPDIITHTICFAPVAPPAVLQPEVETTTPTPHNTPNHTARNSPHTPAQSPTMAQTSQQKPTTQPSPTPLTAQHQLVTQQLIIPNLPQNTNPNPVSVNPMVTHFRVGTNCPTQRLNLHVSSVSPLPKSHRDAFNDPNWQNAMCDECNVLIKNKTWTLVPRPTDTNIVHCMWLFRNKYFADGTLSRYKARLVVNGSTQLEGVDVDETFSPVVKPGTIQTVLSLATSRHWPIRQLDVKNAFLHGDLSETVYMHQPLGFWDSVHPNYMCLLQRHGTGTAYLLLYVDDIVLTAPSETLLEQYAVEILERDHMANCNSSQAPVDTESKLGDDGDPISDPTLYRSLTGFLQ